MASISSLDKRFGDIAIDMQLLSREKLDRALVVQELVLNRTKVHMAIGKVLKEMGALTQEQIDSVLEAQKYLSSDEKSAENEGASPLAENDSEAEKKIKCLSVTMPKDKLSAFISPSNYPREDLSLEEFKDFLASRGVIFGLVEDKVLEAYLALNPLPPEPVKVAEGIPPVPGKPSEIIYHFDTDPLRIGTMKEDGSMDWKDRGKIPQTAVGDLLAEKTKGDPGKPGMSVSGKELQPPRLRNPKLKSGRGTQRSEDGNQLLAKIDGTPRLCSDGKVYVFGILSIDGDIGVETGHIEYEGHIETTGGVATGYTVKGKSLRTAEIQDATIEVKEDLECLGGIYGSTIKVGGNMKASHIHNCTIEVLGELVVKKEIYDSAIEISGRCLIVDGKVIDSRIDAKKGVYAREIGSEGSMPCELTVGFDRQYERNMADCKTQKSALERQMAAADEALPQLRETLETKSTELRLLVQEQESYTLQKRQFEEQLRGEGPNAIDPDDEEERLMLEEMIGELLEKNDDLDARVRTLMDQEDKARSKVTDVEKRIPLMAEHIEKIKGQMEVLDASLKLDPGISVVKVHGRISEKTKIVGPHKELSLPKDMQMVRIAETKVEESGNRYRMKISNLR
ncbi:MAG: FapA family protein [Desulfobacteraceae bacterium]